MTPRAAESVTRSCATKWFANEPLTPYHRGSSSSKPRHRVTAVGRRPMFRLSAIDAVSPAFGRMNAMLFRPFRFKAWLKIGFIGWLAGAGAGGFKLNMPSSWNGGGGHGGGSGTAGRDVEQTIRTFFSEHLLLIVLIVATAILIGLGFFYLACRFRFILFD